MWGGWSSPRSQTDVASAAASRAPPMTQPPSMTGPSGRSPTSRRQSSNQNSPSRRSDEMHIDMAALRALEHEKGISFDVVVEAIEAALLSAYHRSPGAHQNSRVALDRKSGDVKVWAREELETAAEPSGEEDDDRKPEFGPEFDDTPEDFGRYAAAIARQLIFQRLRDAEDEQKFGEFSGKVG